MLHSVYVLWLGGFLVREDWNAAFSASKIEEIRGAKVSLVKPAVSTVKEPAAGVAEETIAAPVAGPKAPEVQIPLEDYLGRVEKAETLYDVLGIADDSTLNDIKTAYFSMAKQFHPDRFHREEGTKLRRIQVAFTEIAHAYETLKTPESRENYNFKMRKELENREKRRAAGQVEAKTTEDRQAEQGLESFEKALDAINQEEFAAAAGHLSRAVHYSPQNALYHAYFGQALSYLEKQHHKAEASLQTAVKLDPQNPKIRMMLVEFFIDMKMTKRAEGELKRFLEIVPGNKEAMKILSKMEVKAEA
jgi:curved DNA-binding protein CbpA